MAYTGSISAEWADTYKTSKNLVNMAEMISIRSRTIRDSNSAPTMEQFIDKIVDECAYRLVSDIKYISMIPDDILDKITKKYNLVYIKPGESCCGLFHFHDDKLINKAKFDMLVDMSNDNGLQIEMLYGGNTHIFTGVEACSVDYNMKAARTLYLSNTYDLLQPNIDRVIVNLPFTLAKATFGATDKAVLDINERKLHII